MSLHPGIPISPIDITTPEFARAPLANFDTIRRTGPVVYVPSARATLLLRRSDVTAALRNEKLRAMNYPGVWSKVGARLGRDYDAVIRLFSYMPFMQEGSRHETLRNAFATGLARVAGGTPHFAASVAGKVAAMRRQGGADIARNLSRHLLFDIMCDVMQIPTDERSEIRPMANMSWAIESSITLRQRDEFANRARICIDYLSAHARASIGRTGPGFLSELYEALPAHMNDKFAAVAMFATILFVMGNDAAGACVSMGVERLLDPALPSPPQVQWASVSDDIIRYAAPVDFMLRTAAADTEVAGCPLAKGQHIFASVFAANHDPEAFGERHLDLTRESDVGLAFGAGRHLCVGRRLTRTVVKIAFEALAGLPTMRLSGAPLHGKGTAVRTLESLPVEFT